MKKQQKSSSQRESKSRGEDRVAYLHSCHSMRVLNLLNTEDFKDLFVEIKGENLESRVKGFIGEEEGNNLELGLAKLLRQQNVRLPNPKTTALGLVTERIAVADIFFFFFLRRRVFCVISVFPAEENVKT